MQLEKELLSRIEEIGRLGTYQLDFRTLEWSGSDNFIRIFGLPHKPSYTQEEFIRIVHPDDVDMVMAYFNQCLEQQIDFNYEYRCLKPDGSIMYVVSLSKITYAEDGTPLHILGVKQDITARKSRELKVARLNWLNKQKNKVLRMVAHDLRSPLAQIVGINELMLQEREGEDRKYHEMINDACSKADHIISDLIGIMKTNPSVTELKKVRSDLNDLVQKSIATFRWRLQEKNINLETDLAEDAPVRVDRQKMLRVIDNLLSNAIKFTPASNSIHIETDKREDKVVLKIRDQGIGIGQEDIPLLFDEFSRPAGREGTEGERSIGMGLSIVKQFIDMHGGEIEVNSNPETGTTFTVSLAADS